MMTADVGAPTDLRRALTAIAIHGRYPGRVAVTRAGSSGVPAAAAHPPARTSKPSRPWPDWLKWCWPDGSVVLELPARRRGRTPQSVDGSPTVPGQRGRVDRRLRRQANRPTGASLGKGERVEELVRHVIGESTLPRNHIEPRLFDRDHHEPRRWIEAEAPD